MRNQNCEGMLGPLVAVPSSRVWDGSRDFGRMRVVWYDIEALLMDATRRAAQGRIGAPGHSGLVFLGVPVAHRTPELEE
jgi:hypothetical protein